MPVVSNTSPILNLAIVNQLELLRRQFGKLLIPNAVLDELKINEERPGSQAIHGAISSGWIQAQEASNEPLAQLLRQTLDRGEAEAIALAIELNADWTLLDEREGRKVAKSLGLRVTGILGVLLRARQAGKIGSLQLYAGKLGQWDKGGVGAVTRQVDESGRATQSSHNWMGESSYPSHQPLNRG